MCVKHNTFQKNEHLESHVVVGVGSEVAHKRAGDVRGVEDKAS